MDIEKVIQHLQSGGAILYPTDTLWGLGVDATNADAIERLRLMKGSGGAKHYSIVVSDMGMAAQYAAVTPLAEQLAQKFLPGKLTLVLEPHGLPESLGAADEVGIRIPNHPVPLSVVQKFGRPITATSANVSGVDAPLTKDFIQTNNILVVEEYLPLPDSLPSTVVDARGARLVVIREGAITKAELTDFESGVL
ncbi:MAG: hypothetical protein RLZZ283_154 [Candidatus Parcubacteria bacterium]|jgi:L-threonylcarbamoyladenylate synthase